MTFHIGDRVRYIGPNHPGFSFSGLGTVRTLPAIDRFHHYGIQLDNGQMGGGTVYAGRNLWISIERDLALVVPRGARAITEPPERYGPYRPIAKALP
jgi:hypothetical protein